jgi:hypothetical protein
MKQIKLCFAIILLVTGLCSCAGGAIAPATPGLPTSGSAGILLPETTGLPARSDTATPLPPTPNNLPTPGRWRAQGVGLDWTMEFEITFAVGKPYFRLISIPVIQCGDTKIRELPWQPAVEIIDGKLQALDNWSIQLISPDRIEGTRSYPSCNRTIQWVATIDNLPPPSAIPSP